MLARVVCPDLQGFAGQQQQLHGSVVDGCSMQSGAGIPGLRARHRKIRNNAGSGGADVTEYSKEGWKWRRRCL